MSTLQLCKAIRNQKGSITRQSENVVRVQWNIYAKGEYMRDSDGRWSYRGSIK